MLALSITLPVIRLLWARTETENSKSPIITRKNLKCLTISFLGYRTQKIKVSDMRSLVIKLLEDTQACWMKW